MQKNEQNIGNGNNVKRGIYRLLIYRLLINMGIAFGIALFIASAMHLHASGYFFLAATVMTIVIPMSYYWMVWDSRAKADLEKTNDFTGI